MARKRGKLTSLYGSGEDGEAAGAGRSERRRRRFKV